MTPVRASGVLEQRIRQAARLTSSHSSLRFMLEQSLFAKHRVLQVTH